MSSNGQRSSDYENIRKQRLEENMKRMKELNLTGVFKNLAEICNATPKTQQRIAKPRSKVEIEQLTVRRSSRVANLPAPDYRETDATFEIPGLQMRRSYGPRAFHPIRTASNEEREEAIENACKIEKDLGSAHPLFLKSMLPSHVSGGFWLGLPSDFCNHHMPKNDDWFNLEDEEGNLTPSLYLAKKIGLSAGWRGFAISHSLQDGDCLIFQKTNSRQFKVFIVRVEGKDAFKESDGIEENHKGNGDSGSESEDIRLDVKQNKKRKNGSQNDMTKKCKTDKKSQIPKNQGRKPKSKCTNDKRLTQMLPTKKRAGNKGNTDLSKAPSKLPAENDHFEDPVGVF